MSCAIAVIVSLLKRDGGLFRRGDKMEARHASSDFEVDQMGATASIPGMLDFASGLTLDAQSSAI